MTRSGRRILASAVVCLGAMLVAGGAAAQGTGGDDQESKTSGRVEADAANPNGLRLACSWALADVDGDWSNGMTYVAEPFVGDATPNERPLTEPCSGAPATQDRLGTEAQVDLLPMPRGDGTLAYLEMWAVVELLSNPDDPASPLEVSWQVRRPDGSVAFTAAGARYRDCRGPEDMFPAAVATGQVSPDVARPADDGLDSFAERCDRRSAFLVFAAVPVAASEPWGTWSLAARAADGVATDELVFAVDVLPVLDVRLDATGAAWPAVKRSEPARVEGDLALDTLERPTIVGRGNVGVGMEVEFERACLVGAPGACEVPRRSIDRFGAGLKVGDGTRVLVGEAATSEETATGDGGDLPVPAGTPISFGVAGSGGQEPVLCTNDRAALDLVRFAAADQEPGVYAGAVGVRAVPVWAPESAARCPTDAGGAYTGSADYNRYEPDAALVSVDHWR